MNMDKIDGEIGMRSLDDELEFYEACELDAEVKRTIRLSMI